MGEIDENDTSVPASTLSTHPAAPASPPPASAQPAGLPTNSGSTPPAQGVSPLGTVAGPSGVTPQKPPAVVTALSSVSSNRVPPQLDAAQPVAAATAPTMSNVTTPLTTSSVGSTSPSPLPGPASMSVDPVTTSRPLDPLTTHPTPTSPVPPQASAVSAGAVPTTPTTSLVGAPASTLSTAAHTTAAHTTPAPTAAPTLKSPTSTPTATQAAKPAPVPAKPKKSKIKYLLFGVVGLVVVLLLGGVAFALLGNSSSSRQSASTSPTTAPANPSDTTGGSDQNTAVVPVETTLEYWGLWEPNDTLQSVLDEFQKQNPSIAVRYVQQSHQDYRERLQAAISSGNGPDVFRYHASWVPMLKAELDPMPSSVMSPSEFSDTFYPIASQQLQSNGQLVGVPLEYDGLVLYYNQDILETAGVSPPQTWAELRDAARKLKIPQSGQPLQRGGVAIGTANNVEHFADIIAVLMLQNGATLSQPNSPEGRDALLFYTNFVKQDGVWSTDLPNSTTAFARGDVAMMFAPSWRAFEIQQQNPALRFGTAPLPQLPNNKVTWGTYWAEGVNSKSKNTAAAWQFLKYMSSKDVQQQLFTSQSQVRAFGEPYSRLDLADQVSSSPIVGSVLQDAPSAQGWYMSTFTHDNGINDQINTYYADAVNALLQGQDTAAVLQTLQQGVNQVLAMYGVISGQAPTQAPNNF